MYSIPNGLFSQRAPLSLRPSFFLSTSSRPSYDLILATHASPALSISPLYVFSLVSFSCLHTCPSHLISFIRCNLLMLMGFSHVAPTATAWVVALSFPRRRVIHCCKIEVGIGIIDDLQFSGLLTQSVYARCEDNPGDARDT